MARELMLLVATVIVCLAPGIHGTAHLSFATDQTVNISRTGCGVTKLCIESPDDCDPMGNSNCLFAAVMVHTNTSTNQTYIHGQLSGMSDGYIGGFGTTMSGTMVTSRSSVFVCAQNNGTFFFRTMSLQSDGASLTPVETTVNEIRGSVNGSKIQCEFKIPLNEALAPESHVVLGDGPTNGTMLGNFTQRHTEGPVNLNDPTGNIATTAAPTTAAPTTAAASAPAPAVLFLLCALIWPVVLLRT